MRTCATGSVAAIGAADDGARNRVRPGGISGSWSADNGDH